MSRLCIHTLIVMASVVGQNVLAQETASADSTGVSTHKDNIILSGQPIRIENPLKYRQSRHGISTGLTPAIVSYHPQFTESERIPQRLSFHLDNASVNYSGSAVLASWQSGGITAYGGRQSLPGMSGIESGGIHLSQSLGKVTVGISGFAEKYGYFRDLKTDYGVSTSLSWQITDNISLHAFGSYYRNNYALTPAITGFTGSSNYGGFLRYDSDSWWGIDVGARNTYNTSLRKWELSPIVKPYVKVGGSAIGVDVGDILYNILHSAGENAFGWGQGNPTMGPPIPMGPPPVR